MATKKAPRTESLANLDGQTFKVGDGVHWGFNGDAYPGTVTRISDSGRKVYVTSDDYKVVDNLGGYTESDRTCEFTTRVGAKETEYTLRKSGHFHTRGNHKGSAWSLRPGRRYAQNPSF